jgi:predicted nucleic acid-binding protein
MNDRIFLDTNIIVYSLLQNGSQKHGKALAAMESVQFVNLQA